MAIKSAGRIKGNFHYFRCRFKHFIDFCLSEKIDIVLIMKIGFLFALLGWICLFPVKAQLYFPPLSGQQWDTLSPASLGWCPERIDSLYQHLESNNAKAFILLKDGKIVLEKYFNGHSANLPWYWASAGKTLTAFLTGIAQRENFLSLNDSSSKFLGQGWTSCTPFQEGNIRIRNQLSMTSGLNDEVANDDCTLDTCLQFLADAGTRWAYHNAPYTLLDSVIRSASGRTLNQYLNQKVKLFTGMDGIFVKQDFNNVFYSTARSMARFGLLILNKGRWNNTEVLGDSNYFNQMVSSSQAINLSYGYLWWLNGKSSFMAPTSQFVFPGSFNPDAPADMISGIGKNGQFVQVIPSRNMVWIRMGEVANSSPVPFSVSNDIWKKINQLSCNTSSKNVQRMAGMHFILQPNPVNSITKIGWENVAIQEVDFCINNALGQMIASGKARNQEVVPNLEFLAPGHYSMILQTPSGPVRKNFIKVASD